jgi:type II secretory pathway pseudopilin PulG
MTKHLPTRRRIPPSEEGYVILIAIFLMALLVISLGIAAPQVAKSIQRDRDLETYHRGLQYRRAVQLYYRKFHAYPPNVNALVKTNEIRFLRQKYVDPITNKVDWKPVLFGQNKTPTAMGFFGQPLSGGATSIAGIGPSGGNGLGGSGGGTVMPGGMGFLGVGSSSSSSSSSSTSSGSTTTPTSTSTDNSGGSSGSGSTGSTTSSTTNSTSSTSSGPGSSGISSSSGSSDQSGQTFGGGGIIGFSPASPRKSILVYKKKNHYNEWEFTYDPISDMQTMSGGNAGGNGLPGGNGQAGGVGQPSGSPTFGPPTTGPTMNSPTPTPSPSTQ